MAPIPEDAFLDTGITLICPLPQYRVWFYLTMEGQCERKYPIKAGPLNELSDVFHPGPQPDAITLFSFRQVYFYLPSRIASWAS